MIFLPAFHLQYLSWLSLSSPSIYIYRHCALEILIKYLLNDCHASSYSLRSANSHIPRSNLWASITVLSVLVESNQRLHGGSEASRPEILRARCQTTARISSPLPNIGTMSLGTPAPRIPLRSGQPQVGTRTIQTRAGKLLKTQWSGQLQAGTPRSQIPAQNVPLSTSQLQARALTMDFTLEMTVKPHDPWSADPNVGPASAPHSIHKSYPRKYPSILKAHHSREKHVIQVCWVDDLRPWPWEYISRRRTGRRCSSRDVGAGLDSRGRTRTGNGLLGNCVGSVAGS